MDKKMLLMIRMVPKKRKIAHNIFKTELSLPLAFRV